MKGDAGPVCPALIVVKADDGNQANSLVDQNMQFAIFFLDDLIAS
jgi:hypothetical protein